jgi:tetratricopeptide (TPR) repeat protein
VAKKQDPVVKRKSWWRKLLEDRFAIILFCGVFLVYGNSIFNDYAMDDEFYTAGANKVTKQGVKAIPEIFATRTFYNNDGTGHSYRPVAAASFALEIQFFGENPRVSHFFSVLIYAITILVLYRALLRLLSYRERTFAFIVSLLFLLHPLHTEVVANIKCRDELLALLFGLCSLLSALKYLETKRTIYLLAVGVFFWLAPLAKSSALPFFALIPFALWYFKKGSLKELAVVMIPVVIAMLAAGLIVKLAITDQVRVLHYFENPTAKGIGIASKTATAFYCMGRYLYLHFIPHPLAYFYGFNYVPVATWSNLWSIFGLVTTLVGLVVVLWRLKHREPWVFGIALYLAALLPYSNLIFPAPGVMAERFAYLASIGFCIAASALLMGPLMKKLNEIHWSSPEFKCRKTILLVVCALFALKTFSRNFAWENKETLYRGDMETLSESAKANMLLGSLLSAQGAQAKFDSNGLMQQGRTGEAQIKNDEYLGLFAEARMYYQKATTISPEYYTAWSNLGTTYYFTGLYAQGLPFFKQALRINPDYVEAYFNLGMSYEQLGKLDSSEYYFRQGIKADSSYTNNYEQLARLVFDRDSSRYQEAVDLLVVATTKNKKSESSWNSLAKIHLQAGDTVMAVAATEQAVLINADNLQRLYNLALYFQQHGDPSKAAYYNNLLQQKQREQQQQNQNEKRKGRR